MDEYILFADETNPTSHNPNFCFAGFVVERSYYEDILIKKINNLKLKYFKRTDVIFHFAEMKKNKNNFSILQGNDIRTNFWNEYVDILKNAEIQIIGVYYNQADMEKLYANKMHSLYDVGFCGLLDNYMHFLKSKNAYGQIMIESRTFKENGYLQRTFYEYLTNGSLYFSSRDITKHLTSLGFTVKGDNCIGLQIADIIPSQLLRKNFKKDFHKLCKTICSKIYHYGTDYEEILGIKNLL